MKKILLHISTAKKISKTLGALLAFIPFAVDAANSVKKEFNGVPIYEIYDEKDILNTSLGNFITTAPNDTLYFCNENGINIFDGNNWVQILKTNSTRSKVRTLIWSDEKVFAAGHQTVGKLVFDRTKGIEYQELNDKPLTKDASEHYLDSKQNDDSIFFIGLRSVVTVDKNTEEIHSKYFGTWIKTAFVQNGILYVTTDIDGIWKHNGLEFELLPDFAKFAMDDQITNSDVNSENLVAFSTIRDELYLMKDETPTRAFKNFKANGDISDVKFVSDDKLAVSVAGAGIYVIDLEGNIQLAIDSKLDYRWSAARRLHIDKQGTLWAMFGSTVGKIIVNTPVTPIDERFRPSLDYPLAHYFDGDLYLRNTNRLYKATHSETGQLNGFEDALPNTTFSVSLALATHDGIMFQADKTTYLLRDKKVIELGTHGRLDRLISFREDPNSFIGTSSDQLRLFRREGDQLHLVSEIPHDAGLINKIARDQNNVFWLEVGLGSIAKTWIENDELHFKRYSKESGVPDDWFAIWEHEQKVIFTERTGVYYYNPEYDRFESTDDFEAYFPRAIGPIHRSTTDPSGNIWASFANYNYILWKQEDGSYLKDSHSLNHLGEIYVNQFLFMDDGDAMLLTGSEMFHFKYNRVKTNFVGRQTHIAAISNPEGTENYFIDPGFEKTPPEVSLTSEQDNIFIRISNTYSASLKEPSFQYYLEGMSREWSQWNTSNELIFTNLDHGDYRLRIRTKLDESGEFPEFSVRFSVAPSIFETPTAYLVYFIGGCALLIGGFNFFSRNLKRSNEKLEQMVAERTQEVEHKNEELEKQAEAMASKNEELATKSEQLERNAEELTSTLNELRNAQDQLMTTSRKAGMAEVATNVLHNVGNVLNSINVAVASLSNNLEQHRIDKLRKVTDLINSHEEDLGDFLTNDPRGKAVPQYLTQLANVLKEDFALYGMEVDSMQENIDHVKKIISTQQAHAKTVDVFQSIRIPDLVDSAITLIMGDSEHAIFEVSRNYDEDLEILSDKHRILQIVANFIKNAKDAINEASPPLGMIDINGNFERNREFITLTIKDNGIGIAPENVDKIFTHGFTTKQDGHGFGLHSCANSAKVLGGSLSIESKGINRGAIVTLRLPVRPPRESQENVSKLSEQVSLN